MEAGARQARRYCQCKKNTGRLIKTGTFLVVNCAAVTQVRFAIYGGALLLALASELVVVVLFEVSDEPRGVLERRLGVALAHSLPRMGGTNSEPKIPDKTYLTFHNLQRSLL